MASYPSQTYQFEYADNASTSHPPLVETRSYLPQEDHVRPAFFSYSPDVVKHRKRTSRAQRKVLEEAFRQNPKPSQYTRKLLIHQTGMDRRSLQVWFQNRRAKEKKVTAKANNNTNDQQTIVANPENVDDSDEKADETNDSALTPTELPSASTRKESLDEHIPASTLMSPLLELASEKGALASPLSSVSPVLATKRSYESTPGDCLHPPLPQDFNPNVRRGSAPAPLGVSHRPTPTYLLENRQNSRVDVTMFYPSFFTTPSLASGGDIYHTCRRGSLPASYLPGQMGKTTTSHLPPVPSDPRIRGASLERSRLRLSSHPFAWQVASTHGTIPKAYPTILPSSSSLNGAGHPFHSEGIQSGTARIQTAETYVPRPRAYNTYLHQDTSDDADGLNSRSRYQLAQIPLVHQPVLSDIVPGPLPQPGYSFGTAPAPIPEDEINLNLPDDRDDTNFQYRESQSFPRFSSFASTDSTVSSALYSDEPRNDSFSDDVYQVPGTWQADRRASCPVPFMSSFAGLHVNNREDQANNTVQAPVLNSFAAIGPSQIPTISGQGEYDSRFMGQEDCYSSTQEVKSFPSDVQLVPVAGDIHQMKSSLKDDSHVSSATVNPY